MFRLLYVAIFRLQFKRRFLIHNWQCLYSQNMRSPFELQPEDGSIKKPKHVANMIFYLLIILYNKDCVGLRTFINTFY